MVLGDAAPQTQPAPIVAREDAPPVVSVVRVGNLFLPIGPVLVAGAIVTSALLGFFGRR